MAAASIGLCAAEKSTAVSGGSLINWPKTGTKFVTGSTSSRLGRPREARHECTKQTLARLRPGGTGGPGRGYERSRVARPVFSVLQRSRR